GSVVVSVRHCDVMGEPSGFYAGTGEAVEWGTGNIDAAPMLTVDGHLKAGSACIDAGDPDVGAEAGETDIDGESWGPGEARDIGIDEFIHSDIDGLPDWWELKYFGDALIAVPGDNPDGDLYDNLTEYHLSRDPVVGMMEYY